MRLFCRKDKLPQEIENSNFQQKNSYSFIQIEGREKGGLQKLNILPILPLAWNLFSSSPAFFLNLRFPFCNKIVHPARYILLVTRRFCGRWQYFTWLSSSRGSWATCPSSWWSSRARACTVPWTTISSPSPWRIFSSSFLVILGTWSRKFLFTDQNWLLQRVYIVGWEWGWILVPNMIEFAQGPRV